MKYLCLMDFDGTITSNLLDLSSYGRTYLKEYLINNKMCIISEESFDNLYNWCKRNELECDIASISSSKSLINNNLLYDSINKNIINELINKFNDGIYTTFGETEKYPFVSHFKERLHFFYPKDYKIVDSFDNNILSITIAIQNEYSSELKKYLSSNNLFFETKGKDKNRELLRVKNSLFNKEKVAYNLINQYQGYKTISITDSIVDKELFNISDISIAMINGDDEIKKMAQYVTEYDSLHDGAIKMLDYICHFE